MKIRNKIISTIASIAIIANSLIFLNFNTGIKNLNAYASESYENIITEVNQINSYIDLGLYLEAINLCDITLSTRNISDDDRILLNNDKERAEKAYNDYLASLNNVSYANIINEVNQIKKYINEGLYLEAISLCDSTLNNYTLSPEDVTLLNNLKSNANNSYDSYVDSVQSSTKSSSSSSQNTSYTVYRTKTGSKYHKDGCRYLSKSKIELSKSDAISMGLTPCSVCKP